VNRPRPWVVVGILVAVVVAVNLGLRELDERTRSPGGPASSSFATAPDGTAAYAELLRRFGRPVSQLREPPQEAELDPSATLVLLEPAGLPPADGLAIRRFVQAGGRLVAGGDPTGWLGNVLDRSPRWRPDAVRAARAIGIPEVDALRTAGEGAWEQSNGRVLVLARDRPIVFERRLGQGTAVVVADPSPLQNRLLGEADNAALGLAFAGDRPTVFVESVHGYGPASGLAAIPARWWWVFGGLCLAALVLALARGRRLGPPELPGRELPPARVEFAEAVATQLAKMRPRQDGVLMARRFARVRVARALGLPAEAPDDDLRARAAARGFDPAAVDALLSDGRGKEELLAVGRALRSAEREEAMA
jgi:hypothetical protein